MKVNYDNKDIWLTAESKNEAKFLKSILNLKQVASWKLNKGGISQTQFHITKQNYQRENNG